MADEGQGIDRVDRGRWLVSGSHEGQSPALSSPHETGHSDGVRKTKRGYSTGYSQQRTEASRPQEVGGNTMHYLVVVEEGPKSFGAYVRSEERRVGKECRSR